MNPLWIWLTIGFSVLATNAGSKKKQGCSESVRNLRVKNETADSLSITWDGHLCPGRFFTVTIREDWYLGLKRDLSSAVTSDTSYTFYNLKPCSPYYIFVQTQSQKKTPGGITAYTSVINSETVYDLRVNTVTGHSLKAVWKKSSRFPCFSKFKVQVSSVDNSTNTVESETYMSHYLATNLEPCTNYIVTVTMVFSANTLSLESSSVPVSTKAPANIEGQPVGRITVVQQKADSLVVSWEPPQVGLTCLVGYEISLYDSTRPIYLEQVVRTEPRTFTFGQLKQCERYSFFISPAFKSFKSDEPITIRGQNKSADTFTITTDNVDVENLSMKTSWNTLELQWRTTPGFEACVHEYTVQVCDKSKKCEEAVKVDSPSYRLNNVRACTSYVANVCTDYSHSFSSVSGETRSQGKLALQQLQIANATSDSLTFRWEIPDGYSDCKGQFEVSFWDRKDNIAYEKFDLLTKEYTAQKLKPCHLYFFSLEWLDKNGQPLIDRIEVKGTTKAAVNQTVQDLKASFNRDRVTLEWTVPPESNACVTQYHVCLTKRNSSLPCLYTETPSYNWHGDPCSAESVSVQGVSDHQLVGIPAHVPLRQQVEDLKKLILRVDSVGVREAKISVVSEGIVCVSDFLVRWNSENSHKDGSTKTVRNTVQTHRTNITLLQLDPCTTYNVTVTPRNRLTEIGVLRATLTTSFAEPVLIASVTPAPRGFDVSWQLFKHDTRHCLSLTTITATDKSSILRYQAYDYNDHGHHPIRQLTPCQLYLISLEVVGVEGTHRTTYYNKTQRVTPEVLSVPSTATQVNMTKDSVTFKWDVKTSDKNMCQPRQVIVNCQPNTGVVENISSWNPIMLRLSKLRPDTRYNCSLAVRNEAGHSNRTLISFLPSEAVPGQPTNITVKSSSSEVLVTWEPPNPLREVVTSYTLFVFDQSLTYTVPPTCYPPPMSPRRETVRGNVTQAVVAGLSPATEMLVSVAAATAAGSGPQSKPVTATTFDDVSEPVEDLDVSLTSTKVLLSWSSPCVTNGPLDHFFVNLTGFRPNHITASYTWNVTIEQPLNRNYSTDYDISRLVAEAEYSATVVPIGSSGLTGEEQSSQSFQIPPRIPESPSDVMFDSLPSVQTTPTKATVVIRNDLFPDTEGTIRYYAIIVTGNLSQGPATGWIQNESWPKTMTWAVAIHSHPVATYQATKPWWNPFNGITQFEQYTVGDEECSESDYKNFCNGPLLPDTSYIIRIRAFTLAGWRDSPSIHFRTEAYSHVDPEEGDNRIILALSLMTVVSTVAFIYLSARGHIKWLKIKEGLARLESNSVGGVRERLPLMLFMKHVEKMLLSTCILEEEYKQVTELTDRINYTTNIAKLPHNCAKNRYKNVIPCDATMVKLDGDESNSYINASHIKISGKSSRRYIACQGPVRDTCKDFWRMVIQYKVNSIVMLCMPLEEGKVKCYMYFPIAPEEVVTFDEISVQCTRKDDFTNHIVRHLTVCKDGAKMSVQQFHFTQWVDHRVPAKPEYLVEFIEDIWRMSKPKQAVMTVHCSAGVGRTGTFVAVAELLRKIRRGTSSKLSVPDTVLQLREQRHSLMVQTQDQYCYIYKCLMYALMRPKTYAEKVRDSLICRPKVEIGTTEVIHLKTSPWLKPNEELPPKTTAEYDGYSDQLQTNVVEEKIPQT